jgi:hypothetical protein
MSNLLTIRLCILVLVAVCASVSVRLSADPGNTSHAIALQRRLGPAGLAPLLARWDHMPPGPARDAAALEIDKVAAQRYATTSRLYWYTDLTAARRDARMTGKPILSLRMLGRLDEELSCANSRLMRATLYANQAVATFLREHFVLHWSSERPVPRVTIDFGDGRQIVSTATGNSVHYVLDDTGRVIDVLPGLYAPVPFKAELEKSVVLASALRRATPRDRVGIVRRHHVALREGISQQWKDMVGLPYNNRGSVADALAQAQRATVSKAAIEVPALRIIAAGVDPGDIDEHEVSLWAAAGRQAWGLSMVVLDDTSRALVTTLHRGREAAAAPDEANQLTRVIDRLELHLVADSALNQFRLRPQIIALLIQDIGELDRVNDFVYSTVFHTPKSDAWLGLVPGRDFTGLPGDGRVFPRARRQSR